MSFIVKNTTLPNLLDLIAPHSCRGCGRIGAPLCDCCKNNLISLHTNICPNCKKENLSGKCQHCKNLPPIFVVNNRQTIIGNLIHDFKYNSTRALSSPLAGTLDAILPTINEPVIIVPLPTISRHIRERGYDHTLTLAKELTKIRKTYHIQKIIIRAKNTVQVGSDRTTRLKQAQSAYSLNKNSTIDSSATYLLLDDVWTTGASIKNAIKILQKAGIKKILVSLLAFS